MKYERYFRWGFVYLMAVVMTVLLLNGYATASFVAGCFLFFAWLDTAAT